MAMRRVSKQSREDVVSLEGEGKGGGPSLRSPFFLSGFLEKTRRGNEKKKGVFARRVSRVCCLGAGGYFVVL